MKLKHKISAFVVGLSVLLATAVMAPTASASPDDPDVGPGAFTAQGTVTTSGCYRSASDTLTKYYYYGALTSAGVLVAYQLSIKHNYSWRQNICDGTMQMLIKPNWAYGSLRRQTLSPPTNVPYAGIISHNANAQVRLFPFNSGASNNVYQIPLDWSGPATTYHQHIWLSYPYTNSDTRWIRITDKYTIKLPPGEKFWNCETPNSNGKNVFTFTTTTSYQK